MTQRQNGRETRQRLMEAASAVFEEKGFRDATVSEICERAGANLAAVNYHFNGKDNLYARVWKQAFDEAHRLEPIDGGASPDDPPEERLQAFVRAMLSRLLGRGLESRSGRLLLQEMARPTESLHSVRIKATKPIRQYVTGVVREILGPHAPDRAVRMCVMSVMHQCLAIGFRGGRKPPVLGRGLFSGRELAALAEHVYRFSLGGLEVVKRLYPPPDDAG